MSPGYYSEAAVRDLLAIKEGEKDVLRATIKALQAELEQLKKKS
jgi:hypothetical protein